MKPLKIEQNEHKITVTIQRPEAMNAINFDVMEQLELLLDRIEEEETIRALILTGAGEEAFVSGGDLKEFHGIKLAEDAKKMGRRMGTILKRIEKLPCWTIAAINGAAYGGGWEMMLAFDFRIASKHATFSFSQGKFYLPPGWGGLTRLVEKVGRSTALRWLAETAKIDADTALSHKLIDKISESSHLDEEAVSWAGQISKNNRAFIKVLKQGALAFSKSRWKAIEAELKPFGKFWEDEQHEQRVEKFLKRKE